MWSSNRRSVLRAAASGTALLGAGCSSIGGSTKPPVDVTVLNSTPTAVTIELAARTEPAPDGTRLFSETFDLSAYQPGTRTKGSSAERANAFTATEAHIRCRVSDEERYFTFEASCENTAELDEGFTVEWADDVHTADELRYRQSTCSG